MNSTVVLRICAVLIGLRALTNVFKPFGAGAGLVFFGKMLSGITSHILAPLMGIYMLMYAYAIWTQRPYALPMGIAYVVFVVANLIGFPIMQPLTGITPLQYAIFAIVGFTIPVLTVWLLARQRRLA